MDEIWERAVETALDGLTDHASARTLTLDGAVKCIHGRLPPPSLLEKFENLQHLSIANVGVSSLEQFPRLSNLQKLNLSDNRIAGGLESLVESGLDALRDLDLSNNRIQFIEDLAPLAQLKLVSLDLYECPVTRVKDYRSRVFGLIRSLKYLDKMDAEGNERPESDDEEEDDDDEDEEDDPGSGEVDGEVQVNGRIMNNGHSEGVDGIVDVDEDEESDADEEEVEAGPRVVQDGPSQNGFGEEEEDDDDVDEEEDYNESDDEIDEEDGDEDDVVEVHGGDVLLRNGDDVVEVHEVEDDSSDEDGVEDEDGEEDEVDEDDEEEEEDDEEVDNVEVDYAGLASNGRVPSTEGEIDGHEQGEDDADEDDNGETGEEQGVEDDGEFEDEEEDEDSDAGYLVQRVGQAEVHDAEGSDMEQGDEEDEPEVDEEVEDDEVQVLPSSSHPKQTLGNANGDAVDEDYEDDDNEQGDEEDEPEVDEDIENDEVQVLPSSSHPKRKRDDEKGDAVDEDDDDGNDPDYSGSPAKKHH